MANYLRGTRWRARLLIWGGWVLGYFLPSPAAGQDRFWVVLQEKEQACQPSETKAAALRHRSQQHSPIPHVSALPVPAHFLDSLTRRGVGVSTVSNWLQAAAVSATQEQVRQLRNVSWVREIRPITGYFYPTQAAPRHPEIEKVGKALAQLKPEALWKAGLTGKGVTIGVIDAGYYQAPQLPGLSPIFSDKRVLAHRDFVNPSARHPYTQRESLLDFHGAAVLLRIGGYDPALKTLTGLAPQASFVLARTDHGGRENRLEEEHFVRALEWMDSLGVRLVNASLGYATGFDDPRENYRPDQMDGSSFIARAVQIAVEQKGMTIIVSAGNDGGKRSWQIIGTPADASGVLTIGSTKAATWIKQGYSGIGPAFLPYLKPDLVCYAAEGTSFSAPVITGLAACLLQANPTLTSRELTDILRRSGHLYPYGNTYVGYGVPNASRALALAQGTLVPSSSAPLPVSGNTFTYPVKVNREIISENGGIVIFRKSSATQVIQQEKRSARVRRIKLKRLPGETYTTLQIGPQVLELAWE